MGALAEATRTLAASLARGARRDQLADLWRGDNTAAAPDVSEAIDVLDRELAARAAVATGIAGSLREIDRRGAEVVALWALARADRGDLVLAPVLRRLLRAGCPAEAVARAARARMVRGPSSDALACLPLSGEPRWLAGDDADPALAARAELLLWDAGRRAASVPELAAWLLQPAAFHPLVLHASRRTLRHRAIAARTLAVAADGVRDLEVSRVVRGAVERTVRRLAAHPDPDVWIPAVRAMGRLAPGDPELRRTVFEWLDSRAPGERRRAVTALASMPGADTAGLARRLEQALDGDDPWTVAAVGPAIPYLACERREQWAQVADALGRREQAPAVWWSATRGLVDLARRDALDRAGADLLAAARERALTATPASTAEAMLWAAIRAETDFLDDLDPDARDPDRVLRDLASAALRLGPARVAERAAFAARTLGSVFETAVAAVRGERAAAALATVESAARAAALRLWQPILAAGERSFAAVDDAVCEARRAMARAVAPLATTSAPDFALYRGALRVLAHAADATDDDLLTGAASGARGRAAVDVVAAVESTPWLDDARMRTRFAKPIADALWRAVDATRSVAPFANDGLVYPRFAAWWAVAAAGDPSLLFAVERADAGARGAARGRVEAAVAELRAVLSPDAERADEGAWAVPALVALGELGADDTELSEALAELAAALDAARLARGAARAATLEHALAQLGTAAARLRTLIADPAAALAELGAAPPPTRAPSDEDVAALARAARTATRFDAADYATRWAAGLGPQLAPLVARAVAALLDSHVGREATTASRSEETIGGYRLVRLLGQGQMGAVWLVAHPDSGRYFVMKVPAELFARAAPHERDELGEALELEARVLRSIYHPNLANLIDHGWDGDTPYLVLEYLVGVDLEAYANARLLDLAEIEEIVGDVCAGLHALHSRGLVHRDLKPGNIFLRMDLGDPEASFEAHRHRDSQATPILGAVIIDFGIATRIREGGRGDRVVSGTLGFMAPEQARGSRVIDGRADIYSLAATAVAAVTGKAFFEHDIDDPKEWLRAHARRDPLAGRALDDVFPADVAALLADAASLDPDDRPGALSFARRFEAGLRAASRPRG